MGNIYKVTGIKDATLQYLLSGAIADVDIPFGNAFSLEVEAEEIEFEGDNTKESVFSNQSLKGTIGFDKWSEEVLERLYNKTALTSGLEADEVKRYYMGDDGELAPPNIGLKVTLAAINDTTELAAELRLRVFKAKCNPFKPAEAKNADKWAPTEVEWTAEKTATDLAGAALPSVPTGGALYSISVLS
jgi:hypothetical protein